jgi:hypothetical protein
MTDILLQPGLDFLTISVAGYRAEAVSKLFHSFLLPYATFIRNNGTYGNLRQVIDGKVILGHPATLIRAGKSTRVPLTMG